MSHPVNKIIILRTNFNPRRNFSQQNPQREGGRVSIIT